MIKILMEQYLDGKWVTIIEADVSKESKMEDAINTTASLIEELGKNKQLYLTKENGEGAIINTSAGPVRMRPIVG